MSQSHNHITMVGRVTQPVRRAKVGTNADGTDRFVAGVAIASSFNYRRPDGTQAEEVCYIDADFYGPAADTIFKNVVTGELVLITGRLQFQRFVRNDGSSGSKHVIVGDRLVYLMTRAQKDALRSAASPAAPVGSTAPAPQTYAYDASQEAVADIPF